MKTKNDYLNGATGEIPHDKKGAFSADLALAAEQRGVPAHIVFREFGKREKLSPREYGRFAFAARYRYGDVPVAIALLYHTLELTPQTVKQANLPGRYLGMSLTDLSIQGGMKELDMTLGLPPGTIHPAGLVPVKSSDCVPGTNNTELKAGAVQVAAPAPVAASRPEQPTTLRAAVAGLVSRLTR